VSQLLAQGEITEWAFSIYLSYEGNQIDFGSPSYAATAGESNEASFAVRDTFGLSKTSKWITESAVDGLAFLSLVG